MCRSAEPAAAGGENLVGEGGIGGGHGAGQHQRAHQLAQHLQRTLAAGEGPLAPRWLAREVIRQGNSHSLDGLCEARLHRGPFAGGVCRQRSQRAPGRRFAAVLRGKIAADESFPAVLARVAQRFDQRGLGLRGARRARLRFQLCLGAEVIVEPAVREARRLHQFVDAHSVESALAKEPPRHLEDLFPVPLALCLGQPHGRKPSRGGGSRNLDDARHRTANPYDDDRHHGLRTGQFRLGSPWEQNVLKKNSTRLAAALLTTLSGLTSALASAPQHHDQVPGYFRLKVGDLEVTALYDAAAVFQLDWLKGKKATMDGVAKTLQQDPHLLDAADLGFLVNTGKQLILVDAVGGITSHDGDLVFPNAEVYVAKAESDFWLSPEIAAKAPKDAQPFFHSAQAIAAPYIKAGKWDTFSGSEPIVDGMQLVPLPGHTPGHTGYEFSSKGQKILFWGDIIHAQRVQLQHPEVTVIFDIDATAAAATRNRLLPKLAREDVVIAGPHMLFPSLGRLRKEASGYTWAPVAFTDQ